MKKLLQPFRLIILFPCMLIWLASCEIINPSEDIPFYITIDSIVFADSSVSPVVIPKSGTQRIVDAWVYVDGVYVGTYELPAKIPVLQEGGSKRIGVRAGVLNNGTNSSRAQYPFFSTYQVTVNNVELGKSYQVNPRVAYNSSVAFPDGNERQFFEGFEGSGTAVVVDKAQSTIDTLLLTSDSTLAFDGRSMIYQMSDSGDVFLVKTNDDYPLNTNLRSSYLEVNFRSDVVLSIGFYAKKPSTGEVLIVPFINLLPTDGSWKKVYLNLSSTLSAYPGYRFDFWFKASHDENLSQSVVLMDNINLITLP